MTLNPLCCDGYFSFEFNSSDRNWANAARWFFVVVVLVSCGCGKPAYMKDTAPVSGKVTLDGKPVLSGVVFVLPSSGRSAKGSIAEDGTFTLGTYEDDDGAQIGTHAVIVTPIPPDESGASKRPKSNIPERYGAAYTSGLEITVEPKPDNQVELTLSSGKKK